MTGRERALAALHRILHEGVKPGVALEDVPPGQRPLVHEMVYGVLRRWFTLEADFSRFCRAKPDAWAQLALQLGTYQIRHMRVPAHAAVAETVAALKHVHPRSAGYVNAVLRRVADSVPPLKYRPYQLAELPKWMYGHWRDAFGAEQTAAIAVAIRRPPPLCIAVLGSRRAWMEQAQAAGIRAQAGELSPCAVLLPDGCDVSDLPGYSQGAFLVMDQAAQHAVMAMPELPPGSLILDICAAPGGKTALLAHRFPDSHVVAVELNARRIPRLRDNLARLALENVSVIRADAGCLPFADGVADALLLDAPCSASGVLRRHPDAKFAHDAATVARLAERQRLLAGEALRVLKPGSPLLYAVCSIHPEETEGVAASLAEKEGIRLLTRQRLFPSGANDGFFHALLARSDLRQGC